ncbi:MAG: molybdopterin dinucleotide-binding protein, partial [Actinomycetia bacterium]|nr:molybdopterin dinucleotide-binding protein [Actinomycetes bacterium]
SLEVLLKHWLKHQLKRRDFLKYLGVGLSGPAIKNIFTFKNKSVESLVSLVEPPEGVIPGIPNWYASVCRQCGAGCGIHVKILEGRAKKIEGNPDFPVNYGKVCARGQAGL